MVRGEPGAGVSAEENVCSAVAVQVGRYEIVRTVYRSVGTAVGESAVTVSQVHIDRDCVLIRKCQVDIAVVIEIASGDADDSRAARGTERLIDQNVRLQSKSSVIIPEQDLAAIRSDIFFPVLVEVAGDGDDGADARRAWYWGAETTLTISEQHIEPSRGCAGILQRGGDQVKLAIAIHVVNRHAGDRNRQVDCRGSLKCAVAVADENRQRANVRGAKTAAGDDEIGDAVAVQISHRHAGGRGEVSLPGCSGGADLRGTGNDGPGGRDDKNLDAL